MRQNKLNRRKFLQFSGGAASFITLHQILPVSAKNKNVEEDIINLQVEKTKLTISERTAMGYTVNNSLPAPTIRLKEGQTATIKVTNNLKEDTSIHWHGLILPANMDGVPGVSFRGIKPKETFTYQFPVTQNGTYWYHSHSGMQEPLGHYGAIIIEPRDGDPFEYDRDYVILLSDWSFENPHAILANLKKMPTYYNYQRRTAGNLAQDWEWKQMRMDSSDIADVTGATYTYLLNGKTTDKNWTGIFQQGDKVRLRFINASAMTFFDVRIPGLKMTVVQADGQNVQPVTVDEFRMGVAETYDVIVEPTTQEAYTIFAETMDRSGYVRGTLVIKEGLSAEIPPRRERPLRTMADMGMDHNMAGMDHNTHNSSLSDHSNHNQLKNDMSNMSHNDHDMSNMSHNDHDMSNMSGMNHDNHDMSQNQPLDFSWQPHGKNNHGLGNAATPMMVKNRLNEAGIGLENAPHKVLVYTDLKSLKPLKNKRKPDREIELHLTGNMERYMWSFDGKKYSEDKQINFNYGERLRLTFVNDTMMEHPIHLHGMWMELVNGNGIYQPRKHTIIVKPAEKLSTEIDVDAKGKWAFHCHLMYHMDVGMFRVINVIG
ncbi:MAG: copper resistance system multicopper oxidase [Cyanobacteria bacterium]|nr:copper resistance system multicopper oxidase [Cyanobacteria bacterium CG_2015-16_32_12]NCO77030.1 copper resistance system multicopper oxidase [Cyanobacteria bacterium CG_2015-22_32_23]NCQ03852.1 copper resistance system multicopper oxidase [Cyanobacteria bacterium CG_2015-09_32_10]NCQ41155.1 copper resistance system multicopper oxidase [Cyanobacteria bacterium CG_2015-04_32_10]NCS85557.1 copper resistance system multicopper oxidase [Cyanobacteria bacterium CG_2015-02_32_10]